jgi:hypothetical protein
VRQLKRKARNTNFENDNFPWIKVMVVNIIAGIYSIPNIIDGEQRNKILPVRPV